MVGSGTGFMAYNIIKLSHAYTQRSPNLTGDVLKYAKLKVLGVLAAVTQ